MKKIQAQEMQFCQLLMKDIKPVEAYKLAFPNSSAELSKEQIAQQASYLKNTERVRKYMASLMEIPKKRIMLSRTKKLELIEDEIINSMQDGDRPAFVALMKLHNEMTGDNAPVKTHTTIDILTSLAIKHSNLLTEDSDQ